DAEGEPGLRERPVASPLPAGQHADQFPVLGLQLRPVWAVSRESAQQVEVRENVLAEPAGTGKCDWPAKRAVSTIGVVASNNAVIGSVPPAPSSGRGCCGRL